MPKKPSQHQELREEIQPRPGSRPFFEGEDFSSLNQVLLRIQQTGRPASNPTSNPKSGDAQAKK
jgi:hypothetical protein